MDFDAIIVGTGMGAGALGYSLVNAGFKVLFLERGLARSEWKEPYGGEYPERFVTPGNREHVLEHAGRATYRVNSWIPVLGGGAGGSTAVYGAGLFHFHPDDLKEWPEFTYSSLEPYYRQCDRLFEPNGSCDPLAPYRRDLPGRREFSASARELFDFFRSRGLHPFQTPIGFENGKDCRQCFGFYCPNNCKKTAFNVFIEPALKTRLAHVEYSTTVERLEITDRKITAANCSTRAGPKAFAARSYFLAAGALVTPTILLNSRSAGFSSGLGNQNDLVGRFLMRHLIDFYFVKTESSRSARGYLTEVSVSDFYQHNGFSWGLLNSIPSMMSPAVMASEFVERMTGELRFPVPRKLLKHTVRFFLNRITRDRIVVCSILEDSPDRDNRVLPQSRPDELWIQYRIVREDKVRLRKSRRHLKRLFRPLGVRLLRVAEDSSFLAHACGTCRMAENPADGVVNPQGKVFGTENLYVADASLFPTSGGSNPSLTVAACAMKIGAQFTKSARRV